MFITTGCKAATIELNKKIEIESTPTGFELQLTKKSNKVVIAVIDTGFDSKYNKDVNLCETGHKNFASFDVTCRDDDYECKDTRDNYKLDSNNAEDDGNKHGTHIAGLIAKNITVDYCLMIIKWYSAPISKYSFNIINSNKALKWAIDQGVDIINYSAGGTAPSPQERSLVLEALDKNIMIVTASGNESLPFNLQSYYPALYDKRVIVVGNLMKRNKRLVRHPSSNYGKEVDLELMGTNIMSINGRVLTGTSQATAIATGRLAEHVKVHKLIQMMRTFDYGNNYYSPLDKYMRQ